MGDNFEKKGRGPSPTEQELEFLFDLIAKGYEDREIAFQYQEQPNFPPRDQRFIRSQRRYFSAARKVLSETIKVEQDPLVIEARRKHFQDLCEAIRRVERAVELRTSVCVNEGYKDGQKYENWLGLIDTCQDDELSDTDRKDAWGRQEISGDVVTNIPLSIEEHPLFGCLAHHLEPKTWELFIRWKQTLKQLYQQELYCRLKDRRCNWEFTNQLYHQQEENCNELLISFGRARYKGVFAGKCEACP